MQFIEVTRKFVKPEDGWLYLDKNDKFQIQSTEPSEIFERCKMFFGFGKFGYVTLQSRLDRLKVELMKEATEHNKKNFGDSPIFRRLHDETCFLEANICIDNLQRNIHAKVATILPFLIYKVLYAVKSLFGYLPIFEKELITKDVEYTWIELPSPSPLTPYFELAKINQKAGLRFSIFLRENLGYVLNLIEQDPTFMTMLLMRGKTAETSKNYKKLMEYVDKLTIK